MTFIQQEMIFSWLCFNQHRYHSINFQNFGRIISFEKTQSYRRVYFIGWKKFEVKLRNVAYGSGRMLMASLHHLSYTDLVHLTWKLQDILEKVLRFQKKILNAPHIAGILFPVERHIFVLIIIMHRPPRGHIFIKFVSIFIYLDHFPQIVIYFELIFFLFMLFTDFMVQYLGELIFSFTIKVMY